MMSSGAAGFIFQGLSMLALAWLLFLIHRTRSVRSWPTVTGTIIESRVESDTDSNAFPYVRYQYTVHGKEYTSDRILPHGQLATTGRCAARTIAKYKPGGQVQVYVNPVRPSDSALELQIPGLIYVLLFCAALVFWWMGTWITL